MKLGFLTAIWATAAIPLGESLRRAARGNIHYVDIFARNQGDPTYLSQAEKDEAARIIQGEGLTVSGMVSLFQTSAAMPDKKAEVQNWDYMLQCFDFAEQVGAKQLTYLPGDRTRNVSQETAWECSVNFARRCASEAKKRGLYLALEVEPLLSQVVHDVPGTKRFLAEVDSPYFRLNIDTGHFHVFRTSAQDLHDLAPYIIHAHLSDNRGSIDEHDILGRGNCPNTEYITALIEGGIDQRCQELGLGEAVAAIEIHFNMVPNLVRPGIDQAIHDSVAWCAEHLPLLKL